MEVGGGALKGAVSAEKALQRTETRELLEDCLEEKEYLLYLSLDEESLLEDPEERVPADLTAGGFCNIELGHFSHSQRKALFSKF